MIKITMIKYKQLFYKRIILIGNPHSRKAYTIINLRALETSSGQLHHLYNSEPYTLRGLGQQREITCPMIFFCRNLDYESPFIFKGNNFEKFLIPTPTLANHFSRNI